MMNYTTGDLFQSDAQALVNTVNCEGYMGKGIAYQFKQRYPRNFEQYRTACKTGALRPGKLLCVPENGRLIVNFPTKDKWRNDSKMSYIDDGLSELVRLMRELRIESIAIPPLGAGNGGLVWAQVRELIEIRLQPVAQFVRILIYEPSAASRSKPVQEPRLSASALVLMEVERKLRGRGRKSAGKLSLQKGCYFVNVFLGKPYFKFEKYRFGPYCHPIDVISGDIKDFKEFHNVDSTEEAEIILYRKIVSESVNRKMAELSPAIEAACQYVNAVRTVHELEGLATAHFLIALHPGITREALSAEFLRWSPEKAAKFDDEEISSFIERLYHDGLIERDITAGFVVNPNLREYMRVTP